MSGSKRAYHDMGPTCVTESVGISNVETFLVGLIAVFKHFSVFKLFNQWNSG